jgi:hypothetical protein
MHYELWDAKSANVIAIVETEAEGLALVRRLLSDGWDPEHLTLGLDFDEGEPGDDDMLPPAQGGAELAARARGDGSAEPLHRA